MGRIVGRVAVCRREVNGDSSVIAHGQNVQQLLQVWAMILIVAKRNGQGSSATHATFFFRFRVSAEERYAGLIVVQFIEIDLKFVDHLPHDGHDQIGIQRIE